MAGDASDVLLGVRDGLLRFFHDGLDRAVPVAVVPQDEPGGEPASRLPLSDAEMIEAARERAAALRERLLGTYPFYLAACGGLHRVAYGGRDHLFVRSWVALLGPVGEAVGGSGSVELPERFVGEIPAGAPPVLPVPGTRRRGGLLASLTGGLETRRTAVSLATLHALSSFFAGLLESRPVRGSRS